MAFMNSGGFVFPINPIFNGMYDSSVNECVPETVGVGERVPVTVRARVTQTVRQTVSQSVDQPNSNRIQVTVQQNLELFVPVQQGITNPVQQRQTVNQTQEIPVADIQPVNQALQDFVNQNVNDSVGANVPIPVIDPLKVASAVKEIAKQTEQVLDILSEEVAATNATATDLATEAAARAAGGVDEAAQLAQKVKAGQVPINVLQQSLSKSGIFGEAAQEIINTALNTANSADDLASVISRNISQEAISAVNNVVQFTRNSRVAQACTLG